MSDESDEVFKKPVAVCCELLFEQTARHGTCVKTNNDARMKVTAARSHISSCAAAVHTVTPWVQSSVTQTLLHARSALIETKTVCYMCNLTGWETAKKKNKTHSIHVWAAPGSLHSLFFFYWKHRVKNGHNLLTLREMKQHTQQTIMPVHVCVHSRLHSIKSPMIWSSRGACSEQHRLVYCFLVGSIYKFSTPLTDTLPSQSAIITSSYWDSWSEKNKYMHIKIQQAHPQCDLLLFPGKRCLIQLHTGVLIYTMTVNSDS